MTIQIKLYNNKWQIQIENEIWEFDNLVEMQKNLNKILEMKDKFGRIKEEKNEVSSL